MGYIKALDHVTSFLIIFVLRYSKFIIWSRRHEVNSFRCALFFDVRYSKFPQKILFRKSFLLQKAHFCQIYFIYSLFDKCVRLDNNDLNVTCTTTIFITLMPTLWKTINAEWPHCPLCFIILYLITFYQRWTAGVATFLFILCTTNQQFLHVA